MPPRSEPTSRGLQISSGAGLPPLFPPKKLTAPGPAIACANPTPEPPPAKCILLLSPVTLCIRPDREPRTNGTPCSSFFFACPHWQSSLFRGILGLCRVHSAAPSLDFGLRPADQVFPIATRSFLTGVAFPPTFSKPFSEGRDHLSKDTTNVVQSAVAFSPDAV